MYPAKLSKLEARLDSQLPLLGGCLRQRAAQALARDGSPDAVRSLAKAVTRSDDRQVLAIALDALRQIKKQQCINEVCAVWAVTRHKDLASLLIKKGWVASTPVDVKVLSALKAEKLEVVTKGGAEIVEPLLKAFSDADSEIANGASQCAIALTNPDAVDYLCQRWSKTREQLLEQVVLQGGYVARQPMGVRVLSALKTGKGQTIARDEAQIITFLLQACKDTDPKIATEATAMLGKLRNQVAIDALCSEWVKTRAKHLTEALQHGQYVAASPAEVRVLSALKVGRLEAVINGETEVVELLLQSCKDADSDIAKAGQLALRKLKNPEAQEVLCRLVIEQDHQLAREIAVASQYTPRDSNHRALFYFLTEQWDKYESLDFEHTLLQTKYELGNEQLRQRIVQKVRQAGRAEWVQIIAGGHKGKRRGEMTPDEWETALEILNSGRKWEEMWQLAQAAPPIWSVRLLQRLKETEWVPKPESTELVRLGQRCVEEMPEHLFTCRVMPYHYDKFRFSPDGNFLVVCTVGNSIILHRLLNNELIHSLNSHTSKISESAFDPDGKLLKNGHTNKISKLAFSPDGQLLISGSHDQTIKVWSLSDGRLLHTLTGHISYISHLAITPDGQLLISSSGSEDKTIKVWSLSDGRLLHTLTGHTDYIRHLAITLDGQVLISGSEDKTIKLWSLPNGKLLHTLKGHTNSILSLAFSPDKQLMATSSCERKTSSSSDTTIRLWSLPDGKLLQILEHNSPVNDLIISPDGQLLLSYGLGDKAIKIWSLPSGNLLKTLTGHTGNIGRLAITSDRRMLASSSYSQGDNNVRLWSLPDGKLLHTLTGHINPISSLVISPNGQLLISESSDSLVKMWSLPNGKLLHTLHHRMFSIELSPDAQTLVGLGELGNPFTLKVCTSLYYLSRLPVLQMSAKHMGLVQEVLQNENLSEVEQGWLEFILALRRWQQRFDVEVEEVPQRIDAGEFDIEIEG